MHFDVQKFWDVIGLIYAFLDRNHLIRKFVSLEKILWGHAPFSPIRVSPIDDISASKGRTELNNHFKMFRIVELYGTEQGFKVIS